MMETNYLMMIHCGLWNGGPFYDGAILSPVVIVGVLGFDKRVNANTSMKAANHV